MGNIYNSLIELIGETPLVALDRIGNYLDLKGRILAKIESFNPGGSTKDRAALSMIEDAETTGRLRPGGTIIEPTSGNTGIGLAWIGGLRGYRVILCMPETMSRERRDILAALGAELVLTPGAEGMKGSIARAEQLQYEIPGSVIMGQFNNPANPRAHMLTTAREIWRDTGGNIDAFVAGVGTGGTITGVGRALKKLKPSTWIVAVEPSDSPVLSGGNAGPHKIQGIGAGMVPANYDASVVDVVVPITSGQARDAARLLARKEGILAGYSSGAALAAAIDLAMRENFAGKNIVVLLPDTGDRYLSTDLFSDSES